MSSASQSSRVLVTFATLFLFCSCTVQQSEWDDIDYSKVINRNAYENDGRYTPPTIFGCIDDDLYNCN